METVGNKALIDVLTSWTNEACALGATAVYLFGSLIYKDGMQFMDSSDIDLVLVMPVIDDAAERQRWLGRIAESKVDLETALFRMLQRSGLEPITSMVAVTHDELIFDVHKDGHREFFRSNTFLNLSTHEQSVGIDGAGTKSADRFVAASIAFAQKVRNEYLSISASAKTRLGVYRGSDPLPKRVMRAAAMAARAIGQTNEPGAEHDVQEGLDIITHTLYAIRDKAPAYRSLQDVLSVRRQARGTYKDIEPGDQLLLAEIIFDLVTKSGNSSPKQIANNQSRIDGASGSDEKKKQKYKVNIGIPFEVEVFSAVYGSSTAFFAERFKEAFPGIRQLEVFDSEREIEQRITVLLKEPLTFSNGHPIWWWRGGNLQIESFRSQGGGIFLMDSDELKISRIVAVPGSTYRRSFVYVRTDGMEPTGLYKINPSVRDEFVRENGYDYEEYGLFDNKTPITRACYDDGAASIDGKIVTVSGKTELRVRYTTPYNFIIAANGSPINNPEFDETLVDSLNQALRGDEMEEIGKLIKLIEKLPIRSGPYA